MSRTAASELVRAGRGAGRAGQRATGRAGRRDGRVLPGGAHASGAHAERDGVEAWIRQAETWDSLRARMHAYNAADERASVFRLANAIAAMGLLPPADVYAEVVMAMARRGGRGGVYARRVLAVIDELEMRNRAVEPRVMAQLFKVVERCPDAGVRARVLALADKYAYRLSGKDAHRLVCSYVLAGEVEMAAEAVASVASRVSAASYVVLARCLLEQGDVDLAHGALTAHVAVALPVPRLWAWLLSLAARDLRHDVVRQVWDDMVERDYVMPDDGTCENVVLAAARAGDTELCAKALRVLVARGVDVSRVLLGCLVSAQDGMMTAQEMMHRT